MGGHKISEGSFALKGKIAIAERELKGTACIRAQQISAAGSGSLGEGDMRPASG
jgi:hypothetical protein